MIHKTYRYWSDGRTLAAHLQSCVYLSPQSTAVDSFLGNERTNEQTNNNKSLSTFALAVSRNFSPIISVAFKCEMYDFASRNVSILDNFLFFGSVGIKSRSVLNAELTLNGGELNKLVDVCYAITQSRD